MDQGRGGLLSAGGILSIIVGAFEVLVGGAIITLMKFSSSIPSFPRFEPAFGIPAMAAWLIIVAGLLAVLGIIAIVGGVSAIKRHSFGLSLAGAICALLPLNAFGVLAVIFVSLGKGKFE